jgi:type I restriction enzyme, S subunit
MGSNFVALREICKKITKGTTPTTLGGKFSEEGINFIKSESLNYDGSIDTTKFVKIDIATHALLKKSQIETNDILYSIAGVNLGKCGSAKAEHLPANTNQAVAIIRIDPQKAVPKYIEYYLRNLSFVSAVNSSVAQSAQPNVNLTEIGNFKINLPSIERQKDIVSILSILDEKIGLNQRINKTLEAIAQALFKSWFVDFDPVNTKAEGQEPEGMDEAIAALFPSSLTESNAGLIPEGWFLGKLGDIAYNPRTGVEPTEISLDVPYIGLEHMPRRSISLYEWEGAEKVTSTKSAMQTGDFLFGKLRPYFHKVGISPINGITSTDILIVRPKSDCFNSYLLMLISSVQFVEYTNKTSQGTKMPRTNWQDMSRYESIFPDEQVFIAYDTLVRPMFHRITANIHENKTLVDIRDSLLPKLISGKLRVGEISETVEAVAS